MEELQDAIEDAQYVNAISTQDDGPRPVLAWDIPTEEQLTEWKKTIRRKHGDKAFDLEWTLSSAIGLFLFSAFLKETCNDYARINFCEEIIRWRQLKGRHRVERAKSIIKHFLKPSRKDPESGNDILPPTSEIDEYELERPTPQLSDSIESLWKECADPTKGVCIVGIKGSVLDNIFFGLQEVEDARELAKKRPAQSYEEAKVEEEAPFELQEETRESAVPEDVTEIIENSTNGPSGNESEREGPQTKEGKGQKDTAAGPADKSRSFRLPGRKQSAKARNLPDVFFDDAEAIVMESLRLEYWEAFLASTHYSKLLNFLWYQDRPVVPEDFLVMRVLGRGGFGLVTACKKGTSGKLYAMKLMNKRRIKMKKSEQLALNERTALAAVESPFVVNLKYSFHSRDDIYLVLDLMTGGDLGYHLHQKGRFPKEECQYYAARIMLGLQALHDKRYAYRDLKPENCLLADDGRVKITDLGLATKITPTLHGAAGTRGYWAPEMLRRDRRRKRMPYGHTVDWFSFGCCLAEFISGQNPFRSEAALDFGLERGMQSKEEAIDCATLEMQPTFQSSKFDPDAIDLCKKLLEKDEKVRLGARGCQEIMSHPWFRDINWERIVSDREKPPFVPPKDVNAAPQSEIGTFAEDKAYQETTLEQRDEEFYKNWDWTNPRAFAAEVIEFMIYERETGEPLVPQQQQSACCCAIS